MNNVKKVRKELIATGKVKSRTTFRLALQEMLAVKELTEYDIVYSLNCGKFDEKLRRRVHAVLSKNKSFACVAEDYSTGRRTYALSEKTDPNVVIETRDLNLVNSPVNGMEQLLTEVMNAGLGQAVKMGGVEAIDAFKELPVKQQARHIATLARRSRHKDLYKLFLDAGYDDTTPRRVFNKVILSNARYVVSKVNQRHEYFDNVIKPIYG